MIRLLVFIFSANLLITTVFLADYRAHNKPDSTSILSFEYVVPRYQDERATHHLIEYNMVGRKKTIFTTQNQIVYSAESPDRNWLLVTTYNPSQERNQIYLVDNTDDHTNSLVFETNYQLGYAYWRPASSTFIVTRYETDHSPELIIVQEISLKGKIVDEYRLDTHGYNNWLLLRQDNYVWKLLCTDAMQYGYTLDWQTGTVQPSETTPLEIMAVISEAVSPNRQLIVNSYEQSFKIYPPSQDDNPLFSYENKDLWFSYNTGWSADSQWIAVDAETQPLGAIPSPSAIYVFSVKDRELHPVTDNLEPRFLSANNPYEDSFNPFSYRNNWVLFFESPSLYEPPYIRAIRTDGSGEEITTWAQREHHGRGAQWIQPFPDKLPDRKLVLIGLLLMLGALGWMIRYMRRSVISTRITLFKIWSVL